MTDDSVEINPNYAGRSEITKMYEIEQPIIDALVINDVISNLESIHRETEWPPYCGSCKEDYPCSTIEQVERLKVMRND